MTDADDAKDSVNSIFATRLRNARAMEAQAKELLERQIQRLDDHPELRDRMRQHLTETKGQQERLEPILGSMSAQASTLKDTVIAFLGNMAGAANMPASDEVLKNSFTSFAFENYEFAAYKSLIAVAELAGAPDAALLLRQSCEEEQAMAEWLNDRLDSVTRQYVSRAAGRAQAAAEAWRA